MMNKIERYIAKTIISSTAIVLAVLMGIQSFIQFAAQLRDVGKGSYQWFDAFCFVPLMLPSDLYLLFPMAALLGSLIGLGRLAATSELIVIRSSGMSLFRLAKAVLVTAVLMLIVITFIGEVVGPPARNTALNMKSIALSGGKMLPTRSGVWLRDAQKFIHIAHVNNKRHLSGITMYQFGPNNKLVRSKTASGAVYKNNSWRFQNVRESIMYDNHIQTNYYPEQTWPINIPSRMLTLQKVDPNQQSLRKLYAYLNFRKQSGQGQGPYEFVFYKRLFQPFATLVMILLAIVFVIGPMGKSSRQTFGSRVVVGIFVGFGFYILNQFFGPMSQVYQIPPIMAALLPSLIFAGIGIFLLRFSK